ncbi:MAG: ABC transporter permease [Ardenticatenales bacterium]|nr:ABC transporter permease [Ardenticatenales bacterium]
MRDTTHFIWKVWRVARLEYFKVARRPVMLVTTFIPLLWYGLMQFSQVGLIMMALSSGERTSSDLLIFDLPPTGATQSIGVTGNKAQISALSEVAKDPIVVFESESSGKRALFEEEVRTLFILDEKYLRSGEVTVYVTGALIASRLRAQEDAEIVQKLLTSMIVQEANTDDRMLLARTSEPLRLRPMVVEESSSAPVEVIEGPQQRLNRFLLAYFMIILMGFPTSYLLHSVSEEKESRIIEIVLSSVTTTELLAGKLVGLVSLGFTQMLIWFAASLTLNRGTRDFLTGIMDEVALPTLGLVALFWLLGCVLYGTIAVVAGSLGANRRDSQQMLGGVLFFLPLPAFILGMVGAIIPSMLESRAAQVLSLFPMTASSMMLIRLLLSEVKPTEIMSILALLILSIVFVLWGGGKLFKLGLLTLGKRPTLRQMARALRG